MKDYSIVHMHYASSAVERARVCILQFNENMASAAYDETFCAVEYELMQYKESKLPVAIVCEGKMMKFLGHKESHSLIDSLLYEIRNIRKTIMFSVWIRENSIKVI